MVFYTVLVWSSWSVSNALEFSVFVSALCKEVQQKISEMTQM